MKEGVIIMHMDRDALIDEEAILSALGCSKARCTYKSENIQ